MDDEEFLACQTEIRRLHSVYRELHAEYEQLAQLIVKLNSFLDSQQQAQLTPEDKKLIAICTEMNN